MKKNSWNWSSVYGKMGMVFLSASAVSVLVFLADNGQKLPENKNGLSYVARSGHGKGSKKEELQVEVDGKETPYTLEVREKRYTAAELEKKFAEAKEELEERILGDNKSLDRVQNRLNLITEIPDTGIRVAWEFDRYDVLTPQGELQKEKLTAEGELVELKAVLSYEDKKEEYLFFARVFPERKGRTQAFLEKLDAEVARLDEDSKTEDYQPLPGQAGGKTVIWKYAKNFRAAGIMLIGLVMAAFFYISERQKEKERQEKRNAQLILDYPRMVSSLTLYLGAGMTMRNAWNRLVEEYEQKRETQGERAVYEEMAYTVHEMKGGASEGECYEHFGERCGVQIYRKFGAMLSQNLRKGTKGLSVLLKQEADNAFEERKSTAKRLGEEAGTKLLMPMFLMLAVVLVMVIVPAFLSIQM